jgi:hypothetical protein
MIFYVSGPVVEELAGSIGSIYAVIQRHLPQHAVDLPLRSRDIDALSPENFFIAVSNMIRKSDAVITVLTDNDQSCPVESTIASLMHKPQCIMHVPKAAPRLLRGLPGVVDVRNIGSGDLTAKITGSIDRLLSSMPLNR